MAEPVTIYAGTTIEWDRDIPDYSADDGYSATYELRNAGDTITISTTGSATTFSVSVTNTASAAYIPGRYEWFLFSTKSGEKHFIDSGWIEIKPDISTLSSYDSRSHVRKTLDILEAVIEGRVDKGDIESFSINTGAGSRSVSRMSMAELIEARDTYRQFLRDEEQAEAILDGKGSPKVVRVRFTGG